MRRVIKSSTLVSAEFTDEKRTLRSMHEVKSSMYVLYCFGKLQCDKMATLSELMLAELAFIVT